MNERNRRKEMLLKLFADPIYKPLKIKELAVLLQVDKAEREELGSILDELLFDEKIEISKRGRYSLAKERIYEGRYIGHPNGFGFVEVEGREEDLFIPEKESRGAMHGDLVKAKLIRSVRGRRTEARVIEIVEHANLEIVGTFERSGKGYGFVVPDNKRIHQDIFVPLEKSMHAEDEMKVVCKINTFSDKQSPEGEIIELLGFMDEAGVDVMCIAKGFDLPDEFSNAVLEQAERVAKPVSDADCQGRLDLRDVLMVTIDGEDAKDLDDAVSLTVDEKGYHLGVHIADVTNYVQEKSALDREALARGTSVYLVDQVIPMLPRTLSNGICSLNQGEDRLALSCLMTIDKDGKVIDSQIAETVIRVNRRMSYTQVKRIIEERDEETIAECAEVESMLIEMGKLAAMLRKKRFSSGSIDFDLPETKVILDDMGRPIEIKPYDRNEATKLIEEFMLLANRTVAETYYWLEMPFVYRTHGTPDPEKIRSLSMLAGNLGYYMKGSIDEIHPKQLQQLLELVEGTPQEALLTRLTLRSMQKAKYGTECTGHFGLAFEHYCHFTSPIRRYPDLQIHRIIKDNLRGRMNEKRIEHYDSILTEVAKKSSQREIVAAEAERETVKLKKVEFMSYHIGEIFEGVISGVTSWGIYVELENTAEGLVPIGRMQEDNYIFNEEKYELVGDYTGITYTLGQKVKVKVDRCDLNARTIDFLLEI